MYKNEDCEMMIKPVELTDEELSLVSGGHGPGFVTQFSYQYQYQYQYQTAFVNSSPSSSVFVTQSQFSYQYQTAFVGGFGPTYVTQNQISLQDQSIVIN